MSNPNLALLGMGAGILSDGWNGAGNGLMRGMQMQMQSDANKAAMDRRQRGEDLARERFEYTQERDRLDDQRRQEEQAREREEADKEQRRVAESSYRTIISELTTLIRDAEYAANMITQYPSWSAGFFGDFARRVPGSVAARVRNSLDSVRAIIGFNRLQRMRFESPTGGALGNVSNVELGLLTATEGSLAQSSTAEDLLLRLDDIIAKARQTMATAESEYQQDFGSEPQNVFRATDTTSPNRTPAPTGDTPAATTQQGGGTQFNTNALDGLLSP